MEDSVCRICGSQDYRTCLKFKDKKRQIVMCEGCGTLRTAPYFVMDYSDQGMYCEHYLRNEKDFRGFARSLLEIILRHKREGRLLDLGCAVGFLIEEARALGFEPEGIELNKKAVEIARSKGFNVKECSISDAGYAEGTFDVVVLNHVLEHIIEPKGFLQSIKKILKRDGILAVGVPNHDSLAAGLCRTRWYGWGVPEHIWHFDKKSLWGLLLKNGFKVKELIQNSQHYSFSKSLRKNTMAAIGRLGNLIGKGDQIVTVAKKV